MKMAPKVNIDLQTLLQSVPYKVLLSMEDQTERRASAMNQLEDLYLDVEWKVPVKIEDIDWAPMPSIFKEAPRYASHAVTMIEMFDEALRRGVDTFMHIEDDVIFHPDALASLPQILVPWDWKFIYFGGRSWGPRQHISKGLVRSGFIYDLHAVIMRTDMVELMRKALLDPEIDCHWCDARIASLHKEHPTYLCRPNLAWQGFHCDDSGDGIPKSNYFPDGSVMPGQGD